MLVEKYGKRWAHIGRIMNRYPAVLNNAYITYVIRTSTHGAGRFTEEEDNEMIRNLKSVLGMKGVDYYTVDIDNWK